MTKPRSLKNIMKLHKQLGEVNFSELIKETTKYKIVPFNPRDNLDSKLLRNIYTALERFMQLTEKSSIRYTGERINDVGKRFENMIEEQLDKSITSVKKLKSSGYPDYELSQDNRYTYLEMKVTGNVQKEKTGYRMFYYSSGNKIKHDAHHFLLTIQMEEEEKKSWKVVSWELKDLAKLETHLKTEFNAGFKDFDKLDLLMPQVSGSEKEPKKRRKREIKEAQQTLPSM